MEKTLPTIPAKRYFTIGEVSELCGVKPYVLRYWEQEFTQLKPMKRRGNRRYYQHHEVLLVRRIRELLYDQGFTISGARNRLSDGAELAPVPLPVAVNSTPSPVPAVAAAKATGMSIASVAVSAGDALDEALREQPVDVLKMDALRLRTELLSIRDLLTV